MPLDELYASLSGRYRPEDVAELARQELRSRLDSQETRILDKAAHSAHSRGGWGYSSMAEEFARPVGLQQQVQTARDLFPTVAAPEDKECDEPIALQVYVSDLSVTIGKQPGQNNFKNDRLNRNDRSVLGLGEMSRRQYNKRFRLLTRMEHKLRTLEQEIRKREYSLVAKSRLASRLPREEFERDHLTACFIAYLTARANLRSVFTNGPQTRAFDEVADMLLKRCRSSATTNWWAIAYVHPVPEVLRHLSDAQKGQLLGMWHEMMTGLADLLRQVWERSRFNRRTMIVKRGDDSTTWNALAGAWNKAREAWIAVIYALNMEAMLERLCPGKVLRLMAADVAAWHRSSGGGLEPDTQVWADLPAPWEVLSGDAACGREDVIEACERHGIDPLAKGWISPRPPGAVAEFTPTPELVHGVSVGHPGLATLLRRMGAFSGKGSSHPVS